MLINNYCDKFTKAFSGAKFVVFSLKLLYLLDVVHKHFCVIVLSILCEATVDSYLRKEI